MPAISRSTFTLFIIAIIIFTPIPVWSSVAESGSTSFSGLGASLAQTLATSQPEDIIPIVVHFQKDSAPSEMIDAIRLSGLSSIVIRHAFHIIPMVSLYIRSDEVNLLAENTEINALTLDRKWQAAIEPIPTNTVTLASNGEGYTHFTETLGVKPLWDMGYNGSGVVVAVLDSGVDTDHPDLQTQIIGFKDFINGRDDMIPGNGIEGYDDNGHGTACIWNVAGDGTASGGNLTGVAPGASILAVKVLDSDGSGDDSVIAEGIEFAMDNGADVISLSLGGEWTDNTFIVEPSVAASEEAIQAGISVITAAGNSGPQAYSINSPGIVERSITVGSSLDSTGVVAFSSVGPVLRTTSEPKGNVAKPDLVAPGYGIVSGRAQDANLYDYLPYNYTQFGNSYTLWAGTSASAPMIAGAVAILAQRYLLLFPIEAKTALMGSATDLGADPMAQGWGLVNVTRASQFLLDTSREITILAPKRFPTLPWSNNVLIVGDKRPPQNITVISTQSRGLVNLTLSGNASVFITKPDQITVTAGYSYFDLSLDIPEDLPMTEIGYYHGVLNLTSYSELVASIEIRFTITLFGGRLMVDMEHHSTTDPDYPQYYGYFTEYLRNNGVILSEFGSPDGLATYIDIGTISSSDVFMIMDTETAYTEDEVTALHQFVENGGTLFVLSEFWDSSTQEASFNIDSYNAILAPYGIQCERRGIGEGVGGYGLVYGPSTGSVVENDTLMEGINSLYINLGSTLSVNTSMANARGLFWEDAAKTHAIVATAEYGRGNVIVVSDGSTLYDDLLYDAITLGADNLRLLRNIARTIVPEAPRIYDVVLNRGEIGEPANVTAYIFDEDLDIVSMSIIGPGGINITGDVVETLGYKFTSSFTYTSGGFYSFRVVARDEAGNERVFQKVILIPVNAADDVFVVSVIYSLLGIVGIGLAYTGYLKISGDRRNRPKRHIEPKEDEWEVPPPSIE